MSINIKHGINIVLFLLIGISNIFSECKNDELPLFITGDETIEILFSVANSQHFSNASPGDMLLCLMRTFTYSKSTLLPWFGDKSPIYDGFHVLRDGDIDWIVESPNGNLFHLIPRNVYYLHDNNVNVLDDFSSELHNVDTYIIAFENYIIIYMFEENIFNLLER